MINENSFIYIHSSDNLRFNCFLGHLVSINLVKNVLDKKTERSACNILETNNYTHS